MNAVSIEISDPVLQCLQQLAQRSSCTLEEAAQRVVHDALRAQQEWDYLQTRAKRGEGKWERFREFLAKAPDVEPAPEDRLAVSDKPKE